jgi:formylglycine-generating enzyme required for sulfatase activity
MLLAPPQQDFKIEKLVAKSQIAVAQPQPKGDLVFDVNGVQFKMKYVEGGEFMMGATAEQGDDAYDEEKPAHKVSLDSYYIGETQVTQALWTAVMGNNPSYFKSDDNPVDTISWSDCQEFIKKLNQLTGQQFSLPTEAQWEFAARGGKNSKGYKYAGSNNLGEVAWFAAPLNGLTHQVALKKPNELGIYDMSGNVWEWCTDWFDANYYQLSPKRNPQGPTSGDDRVLRGGGYCFLAKHCRVSSRMRFKPNSHHISLALCGVRLSLSICDSEQMDSSNQIANKVLISLDNDLPF